MNGGNGQLLNSHISETYLNINPMEKEGKKLSKTIIIDAGHGGTDPGAVGFGIKEKDWTLEISRYQYERLKELGARVYMTRQSDLSLDPTQRIARIKNQYDVCVSNHWNAFNGSARGVETIHSVHARAAFAKDLADAIVKVTRLPLRRVFTREIRKGIDYYFMHRLTGRTETVIIEYGFIDNHLDHEAYTQGDLFIATGEAVVECICRKIGVQYIKPGNSKNPHTVLSQPDPDSTYIGKRVESIHDGQLRFYNKPSWSDEDVFGYVTKGQGFPVIVDKVSVGKAKQYKVRNSAGAVFYITASPIYVRVV